jgi:nanoRNase/pAp phosphatase (c-di-AMP/oligoRNAs hydrolase)
MKHLILPIANRVLVCGHRNPDADSLACCVAVQNYYRMNGAGARIFYCGEIADHLKFLLDGASIESDPDRFGPDVIIVLDTSIDNNYIYRVGINLERFMAAGSRIIAIDHHPPIFESTIDLRRADFQEINKKIRGSSFLCMTDPDQVSCASVLINYFQIKNPVLYNGIRCDTGSFSRKTLAAMEDVRRLNISENTIQYYHKQMRSTLKNPSALDHIKKNGVMRIGDDPNTFHLLAIDENSPRIAKIVLGILRQFYLNVGVVWKSGVSFRSGDDIDVRSIAVKLRGGGHPKAAGSSNVSIRDLALIQETVRNHLNSATIN